MEGNLHDEIWIAILEDISTVSEEPIKPLAPPIVVKGLPSGGRRNEGQRRFEGCCNLLNIRPIDGCFCRFHSRGMVKSPVWI